jgi:TetR/AcrR family transcriptional regulator, hemagglutinin/protease regulatory protein
MATSKAAKNKRQGEIKSRALRLSPEERREHLLACAIKVFAAHGLNASNHAKVAEEAKVSVPTVFFYFNTREALVDAVLAEVERFYTEAFSSVKNSKEPAVETLIKLSQAMTRTLETHPDYARIMREWSVAVRSELWPRYLRTYRYMNRMMARVIERGQREGSFRPDLDPEDEAAILHAGATALIQLMETGADADRLDRFQRAMIQPVMLPPAVALATPAGTPAPRRRAVKPAAKPR